ncbi:MAG TPA: ABC transporter ATP-binding protein [Sporichthyaceae bacterium]|nr:ABC transporter ATP-binding protein [Sporichthyaceae bacterium]
MTMTEPGRRTQRTPDKPLLAARSLDVAYGSVLAVRGLTLHVDRGEIVALLGPNGAGKTSTLRGITGLVRPRSGTVSVDGQRIDAGGAAGAVRAGLAHVPEGRRVFPEMSVLDNLRLGAWSARRHAGVVDKRVRTAYELFPRLSERRGQAAGSLSGGEQQMLAIARALMSNPQLLLIDELSLGLSPLVVDEILARLVELNAAGLSILLIEQFVHRALDVADRIYVLKKGRVAYSGTPAAAVRIGAVEEAYL